MYVIIVGGGKVGYYLTRELLGQDFEVALIEKDKRRLAYLQTELGEVVLFGDGCEVRYMEDAGFGRADVVVAVTGDDEDNLVICQMAKNLYNVKRVLARVNDPANEHFFQKLGIPTTVNSTRIIYNLIEQSIESDAVVPLAALQQGEYEIVEISVSEKSPVVGHTLMQLNLPPEALIMAVMRGGEARIPTGAINLENGDMLIVLVRSEAEEALATVFA